MRLESRTLIVVGDRVLVRPEEGESTTGAGLVLPASVADRESVQAGRVVAVGPGTPVAPSGIELEGERKGGTVTPRHVGMQVKVGDFALFQRKAAVEISVDDERMVVVPQGAILVLLRDAIEDDATVN